MVLAFALLADRGTAGQRLIGLGAARSEALASAATDGTGLDREFLGFYR